MTAAGPAQDHPVEPDAPFAPARPGREGRGAAGEATRCAGDPAFRPRAALASMRGAGSNSRRRWPTGRWSTPWRRRAAATSSCLAGRGATCTSAAGAAPPAGRAATRFAPPPTLVRGTAARALVPGQFDPAAEKAALAFERLLEIVLATAPEEFAIRRLGSRAGAHRAAGECAGTTRRVDLARARVHVRRTLDERERGGGARSSGGLRRGGRGEARGPAAARHSQHFE